MPQVKGLPNLNFEVHKFENFVDQKVRDVYSYEDYSLVSKSEIDTVLGYKESVDTIKENLVREEILSSTKDLYEDIEESIENGETGTALVDISGIPMATAEMEDPITMLMDSSHPDPYKRIVQRGLLSMTIPQFKALLYHKYDLEKFGITNFDIVYPSDPTNYDEYLKIDLDQTIGSLDISKETTVKEIMAELGISTIDPQTYFSLIPKGGYDIGMYTSAEFTISMASITDRGIVTQYIADKMRTLFEPEIINEWFNDPDLQEQLYQVYSKVVKPTSVSFLDNDLLFKDKNPYLMVSKTVDHYFREQLKLSKQYQESNNKVKLLREFSMFIEKVKDFVLKPRFELTYGDPEKGLDYIRNLLTESIDYAILGSLLMEITDNGKNKMSGEDLTSRLDEFLETFEDDKNEYIRYFTTMGSKFVIPRFMESMMTGEWDKGM